MTSSAWFSGRRMWLVYMEIVDRFILSWSPAEIMWFTCLAKYDMKLTMRGSGQSVISICGHRHRSTSRSGWSWPILYFGSGKRQLFKIFGSCRTHGVLNRLSTGADVTLVTFGSSPFSYLNCIRSKLLFIASFSSSSWICLRRRSSICWTRILKLPIVSDPICVLLTFLRWSSDPTSVCTHSTCVSTCWFQVLSVGFHRLAGTAGMIKW